MSAKLQNGGFQTAARQSQMLYRRRLPKSAKLLRADQREARKHGVALKITQRCTTAGAVKGALKKTLETGLALKSVHNESAKLHQPVKMSGGTQIGVKWLTDQLNSGA